MSRRFVALIAAFVLPLAIAYAFFVYASGIFPPALRREDPEILSFAPWCIPLALLCSWIAARGPQGHAWGGMLGAFVGAVVGFVYFWALLITTNGMFLAYPFSVMAAWTIGASLALMLAWTPNSPLAWAADAATVAAIFTLVSWQISVELQPKRVLVVLFRPGTSNADQVKEGERLTMIEAVRGKDFAPGIFRVEETSAGPEGVHFRKIEGVDTTGIAIVFAAHSTDGQRADVVRLATSSPLVARVAWAPPGVYEEASAKQAAEIKASLDASLGR